MQNTHVWHIHKDLSKRKRCRELYRYQVISWVQLITILSVRIPLFSLSLCETLSASFSLFFSSLSLWVASSVQGVLSWDDSEWLSSGCKLSSCTLRLQSSQCSVWTAVNVYVCIILSQWQALNKLLTLYKFLFLSHHKLYW